MWYKRVEVGQKSQYRMLKTWQFTDVWVPVSVSSNLFTLPFVLNREVNVFPQILTNSFSPNLHNKYSIHFAQNVCVFVLKIYNQDQKKIDFEVCLHFTNEVSQDLIMQTWSDFVKNKQKIMNKSYVWYSNQCFLEQIRWLVEYFTATAA